MIHLRKQSHITTR